MRLIRTVMCPRCQVDFQDAEARTVAERRREEERQRRMARLYKDRVEAASKDMEGNQFIFYCQELDWTKYPFLTQFDKRVFCM